MRRLLLLTMMFAVWSLQPSAAPATEARIAIPCASGPPCGIVMGGHIDAYGPSTIPWVASVAVPAGICFDVLLDSSDGGVFVTVIDPSGRVYRPGGGGVQINPTKISGWYTVEFDSRPPAREQILTFELLQNILSNCGGGTTGE